MDMNKIIHLFNGTMFRLTDFLTKSIIIDNIILLLSINLKSNLISRDINLKKKRLCYIELKQQQQWKFDN